MKDKIITLIKKHIITCIVLFIYTIRIFHMYFSTTPLPPIFELLGMLGFGCFMIICVSLLLNSLRKDKSQVLEERKETLDRTISYHKMFKAAGVTFPCKLDKYMNRQKVLEYCRLSDQIHLEEYEYNGHPAFMIVLNKNNLDIGSVPADLVPTILKYKDKDTSVKLVDVSCFKPDGRKKEVYYAKVQFVVYKDTKRKPCRTAEP